MTELFLFSLLRFEIQINFLPKTVKYGQFTEKKHTHSLELT